MFEANGMAAQRDDQLVVVDLGSHRLRVAIFDFSDPDSPPEVIGLRAVPSAGIRNGGVVDRDAAGRALYEAMDAAAQMADVAPNRVTLLVNGPSLSPETSSGTVGLAGEKVTATDTERALLVARDALSQRPRQQRLHEVINHYVFDGRQRIRHPEQLGGGRRLQANLMGLNMSRSAVTNLVSVVEDIGLPVEAVVSSAYAAGYGALEERQRRLGSALLDLGHQTTTLSIWVGEELHHVACRAEGSWALSLAIARGLMVPLAEAERLKREQAGAVVEALADESVEMQTLGLRPPRILNRRFLAQAIQEPLEGMLQWVAHEVTKTGLAEDLDCGLVLCGGGSRLVGLADFTESYLGVETRRARRRPVAGLGSMLADESGDALAGMALLHRDDRLFAVGGAPKKAKPKTGWFSGWFARA
ncbi:MAG: cell division protein FtsA [Myxococcales bacterium]|nr:cell division protein FtsA [Myxococcales bacterium]